MWRRAWHRVERWFLYHSIRLFRLRSATEHVARGFAAGLVVHFFPTFGAGVLISGVVARAVGGSAVAGLVGGASLGMLWPVLFYLNMRTGSLLVRPPVPVEQLGDVSETKMNALVWGQTFTWGAIVNSVVVGLAIYLLILAVYGRFRPRALAYFRQHARQHQRLRPRRNPRIPPAPAAGPVAVKPGPGITAA